MNYFVRIFKHWGLVNKHRWYVFKLAVKAGIPWRGFLHDLSKFSPEEFWSSVKYYNGKRSPLHVCREHEGYAKAWLHHKGRNKHHFEYWEDFESNRRFGVFMPYKYIVEALCDKLAAGMVYKGKDWNKEEPYEYWTNKEQLAPVSRHEGSVEFMNVVLKRISQEGVDAVLNSKYLKKVYHEIADKYNIPKKCR